MAIKKVYFYQVSIFDRDGKEIKYSELKNILGRIIEKKGYMNNEYYSLDVSSLTEPLHVVWDVFNYKGDRLFFRLSKQKPNNSVIQREYTTFKNADILPAGTEKQQGIEQYTFGCLEYESGIFSIITSKGAPGINVLKNVFERYKRDIDAEFIPIPNTEAIQTIYNGEEPKISQIEIEVPLPSTETLEHLFGWEEDSILETLSQRNLSLDITVKGIPRSVITFGTEESQKIIERIISHLSHYKKAKMKAKDKGKKMRDYNFFEDTFSHPVDIPDYHIVNYERVYYTIDELVKIYKQSIVNAYRENKYILKTIIDR